MRHKVLYMFLILMTAEAIFYYWQASRTSTVKLQRNNKHKINKNHAKRKPIDTKIKKNKKIQIRVNECQSISKSSQSRKN